MQGFWAWLADVQFWILFIFVAIPILLVILWRVFVVLFWLLLAAVLWPVDRFMMLVSPAYRARGTPAATPAAPRRMAAAAVDKAKRLRIERRLAKARKRARGGAGLDAIDR
jgi:hypothetical protein